MLNTAWVLECLNGGVVVITHTRVNVRSCRGTVFPRKTTSSREVGGGMSSRPSAPSEQVRHWVRPVQPWGPRFNHTVPPLYI